MEVLIYLFASIFYLVLILSFPILLLYLSYCFGKRLKRFHLDKLLPLTLIAIVSSWLGYSHLKFTETYNQFSSLCSVLPEKNFYDHPNVKPKGVLIRSSEYISTRGRFSGESALQSGDFEWVETLYNSKTIRTDFYDNKGRSDSDFSDLESGFKSKYVFLVMPLEVVRDNGFAPIFISKVVLKEIKSGKKMAEASELVFGGGKLASYMRVSGGDQDFEYHSCGYASKTIGPWRPTLTKRPIYKAYKKADREFISRALTPTQKVREKNL